MTRDRLQSGQCNHICRLGNTRYMTRPRAATCGLVELVVVIARHGSRKKTKVADVSSRGRNPGTSLMLLANLNIVFRILASQELCCYFKLVC